MGILCTVCNIMNNKPKESDRKKPSDGNRERKHMGKGENGAWASLRWNQNHSQSPERSFSLFFSRFLGPQILPSYHLSNDESVS